jgi:hypothetical protein
VTKIPLEASIGIKERRRGELAGDVTVPRSFNSLFSRSRDAPENRDIRE